jgi:hypothetical protein
MYPIAPEDDFPDEFCAIRQGSGEHWFYTPAGEDASWMLFRAESENAKMREDLEEANNQAEEVCIENAKLRELAQRADRLLTSLFQYIDYSRCTALEAVAAWRVRARELGVEVDA